MHNWDVLGMTMVSRLLRFPSPMPPYEIRHADNFRIEWSSPERYEIVDRVGGGKYSEVRTLWTYVTQLQP